MITADIVRDTALKRIALPSEVYALLNTADVELLASSVARVGFINPPTFRLHPDSSLELLLGKKRMAAAVKLKLSTVRIRIIECDDADAELITASETSYTVASEPVVVSARSKLLQLVAETLPAPPPSIPVRRSTPMRVARELLADRLGLTMHAVQEREYKAKREKADRELLERDPDAKAYVETARMATYMFAKLGSCISIARKHWGPNSRLAELLVEARKNLMANWPLEKCCSNQGCQHCLGRGWKFGPRPTKKTGRPVGSATKSKLNW
jgi:hypothetical protein